MLTGGQRNLGLAHGTKKDEKNNEVTKKQKPDRSEETVRAYMHSFGAMLNTC